MFCSSDSAVDVDTDTRRLKDGEILKYKSGFFGSKWKRMHAVLFSDSRWSWYAEKGDAKPKQSVLLKDVVPYICVGLLTDRMPVKRPDLPEGFSVHHLVGIATNPRADTVHWLLFSSDADIESWFVEIAKTLPKPNPPPAQPQNNGGGSVQPSKYPDPQGPPPSYPSQQQQPNVGGYGGGPQNQQNHTTVVVQNNDGYGGNDGGMGFGTGMLAGSLIGFGMGSMWGGHSFGGPGLGMGGAFYSDNDTNITNNYYSGPPPGSEETPVQNGEETAGGAAMQEQEPEYDNTMEDYGDAGYEYGEPDYGGGMDYGGGGDDFGGGGDF